MSLGAEVTCSIIPEAGNREQIWSQEDIMKKLIIPIAIIIEFLVGWRVSALPRQDTPPASAPTCSVPQTWGKLIAATPGYILFDDGQGHIRALDVSKCMQGIPGSQAVSFGISRN
jgi:hypothetical protein